MLWHVVGLTFYAISRASLNMIAIVTTRFEPTNMTRDLMFVCRGWLLNCAKCAVNGFMVRAGWAMKQMFNTRALQNRKAVRMRGIQLDRGEFIEHPW